MKISKKKKKKVYTKILYRLSQTNFQFFNLINIKQQRIRCNYNYKDLNETSHKKLRYPTRNETKRKQIEFRERKTFP